MDETVRKLIDKHNEQFSNLIKESVKMRDRRIEDKIKEIIEVMGRNGITEEDLDVAVLNMCTNSRNKRMERELINKFYEYAVELNDLVCENDNIMGTEVYNELVKIQNMFINFYSECKKE